MHLSCMAESHCSCRASASQQQRTDVRASGQRRAPARAGHAWARLSAKRRPAALTGAASALSTAGAEGGGRLRRGCARWWPATRSPQSSRWRRGATSTRPGPGGRTTCPSAPCAPCPALPASLLLCLQLSADQERDFLGLPPSAAAEAQSGQPLTQGWSCWWPDDIPQRSTCALPCPPAFSRLPSLPCETLPCATSTAQVSMR